MIPIFVADKLNSKVPRGPFKSSYAWLEAYLRTTLNEQRKLAETEEDEGDRIYSKRAAEVAELLADFLPEICATFTFTSMKTALWHDHLSFDKLLVDDQGRISGVLDWTVAFVSPLWYRTKHPRFLDNIEREEKPHPDQYGDALEEDYTRAEIEFNEGKDQLYWIHLLEYELTQMRKIYKAHMVALMPDWEEQLSRAVLKLDFYRAIQFCEGGFFLPEVCQWLNCVRLGEKVRIDSL